MEWRHELTMLKSNKNLILMHLFFEYLIGQLNQVHNTS